MKLASTTAKTEARAPDVRTRKNATAKRALWSLVSSNTSLAIIDQAVVSGTRFLATICIGRLCGREELGVYSLTFAVYLIFACMQEALITTPYMVFGNRLEGPRRYSLAGSVLLQGVVLSLSAALIITCGALLLGFGARFTELMSAAFTLAAVLPFMLLWEFARRYAIAHLKLGQALTLDFATCCLQLAGIAVLAWTDDISAVGGFLALGAGCAVSSVVCLIYFQKEFEFRRPQFRTDWQRNWSFGKWVLGGQITGLVHAYTPAWVLVAAIGTSATGVFSACETLVLLSNPLILAIANLMGATTAKAYAEGGYPAVRQVVHKASIYSAAAMGVLWFVLLFVGGYAVTMLYGEEFSGNGRIVSAIALAAPLWALSCVHSVGMRAVERPDADFRAKVIGMLVTLVLSWLAVTQWGVLGVAYSLVAGTAVSTLLQAWVFYRILPAEYH